MFLAVDGFALEEAETAMSLAITVPIKVVKFTGIEIGAAAEKEGGIDVDVDDGVGAL